MDIEQLRLVLDMLGNAGDSAFTFGLIYMVYLFLIQIMGYGVGIYAIYKASKAAMSVLANFTAENRMRNVRDVMQIGSSGYVSTREYKEILKKVAKEFVE